MILFILLLVAVMMASRKNSEAIQTVQEAGFITELKSVKSQMQAAKGLSKNRLEAMLVQSWIHKIDLILVEKDSEKALRMWEHHLTYAERWPAAVKTVKDTQLKTVSDELHYAIRFEQMIKR